MFASGCVQGSIENNTGQHRLRRQTAIFEGFNTQSPVIGINTRLNCIGGLIPGPQRSSPSAGNCTIELYITWYNTVPAKESIRGWEVVGIDALFRCFSVYITYIPPQRNLSKSHLTLRTLLPSAPCLCITFQFRRERRIREIRVSSIARKSDFPQLRAHALARQCGDFTITSDIYG